MRHVAVMKECDLNGIRRFEPAQAVEATADSRREET